MGDPTNGDKKARLDHIQEQLKLLAKSRLEFQEEYRQLLKSMTPPHDQARQDSQMFSKLDETLAQMRASRRNADEKMAALMITVKLFLRPLP